MDSPDMSPKGPPPPYYPTDPATHGSEEQGAGQAQHLWSSSPRRVLSNPPDDRKTQHEGTSHLAIYTTFTNRLKCTLALKFFSFRRVDDYGHCLSLSDTLVAKSNRYTHLAEAAAMRFVAKNTSIPVPRVHCAFVNPLTNQAVIIMDKMAGSKLFRALEWLTEAQRQRTFEQLRGMVRELRALKPPSGLLGHL